MLINIIPTKMLRRIHVIFALNKYSLSAHSIKTYIHRYRNINDGTTLQLWREQPSLVCGFTAVHLALQVFYYECCRLLLWVFGCYFFLFLSEWIFIRRLLRSSCSKMTLYATAPTAIALLLAFVTCLIWKWHIQIV